MAVAKSLDNIRFFVHGIHGQHGFFRQNDGKAPSPPCNPCTKSFSSGLFNSHRWNLEHGFSFLNEGFYTFLSIGVPGTIADTLAFQFELSLQRIVDGFGQQSL